MFRKEIEENFEIDDNNIITSGKFKDTEMFVPYLWDLCIEGYGEKISSQDGEESYRIQIEDYMRGEYPEIPEEVIYYNLSFDGETVNYHAFLAEDIEDEDDFIEPSPDEWGYSEDFYDPECEF
jgi:hypothetical protein